MRMWCALLRTNRRCSTSICISSTKLLRPRPLPDFEREAQGGDHDEAHGVTVQGGKIVAVGLATVGASEDFALARYSTTGALDTSFESCIRSANPSARPWTWIKSFGKSSIW